MNSAWSKGLSWALFLLGAAWVVAAFLPPRNESEYDWEGCSRLPVEFGTRVVPLDSVARNTLRLFSGRTAVAVPKAQTADTTRLPALQWLLEVAGRRELAERAKVFRVDHDEVLGLLGREQQGRQVFSALDLQPHFTAIESAAKVADEKQQQNLQLTLFESEVQRLRDNLVLFQRLGLSFAPPGTNPAAELAAWQQSIGPGTAAFRAREQNQPYDEPLFNAFAAQAARYMDIDKLGAVGLVPPVVPGERWDNLGRGALAAMRTGEVSPVLGDYAELIGAFRRGDAPAFNTAVAALLKDLGPAANAPAIRFEEMLNRAEPFFRGMILYVLAFLCVCVGWVSRWPELRRTALGLVALAFALQTLGLGARTYLTGFGVVTNLYSSALFVGWVAVILGLLLEWWMRGGLGLAVAAFVGFATLLIAHFLPFSGDDIELPRAVLATNFWLWTHVKIITSGYAAMFVAGTLAGGYIIAGSLTPNLTPARARETAGLVYGVMCFATLFSFVGTMLGGIWADQSWGRFWGWDPKENGALLIVLWCAIFLHARWGRLCSERSLMALAVFGNMVTAWSWFGTNLLGVGLHSYGFMHGTFLALLAFWMSQIALIVVALLPAENWRSRPATA